MTKTKANNFRWKHGIPNVKASAYMQKSMYDADEVVRLMTDFAQSEVKKFHKRAVISKRQRPDRVTYNVPTLGEGGDLKN